MHASSSPSRLLALLLAAASTALASPAPAPEPAAATTSSVSLAPTDAWVSVGSNGAAKTITPVLTTIDGTPTVVSAAPTTTGTATTTVQPEATATNGAGSFPVCSNADGDLAPFCAPSDGSTLNPGVTYYITWDPSFFSASPNTTVIITGNLFNATTGAITTQAFSSNTLAAAWSFYAWTVDKALLSGASSAGVNISLSMTYLATASASNSSTHIHGPIVTVATPQPYRQKPAELPSGAALYIGLPCIVAFVALMLLGTCLWNRRARRIGLGSVMGQSSRYGRLGDALGGGKSRGGYGIRKSRRQRVGAVNLDSKDAIRLKSRGDDEDGYDDFGMSWATTHVDRDAGAAATKAALYDSSSASANKGGSSSNSPPTLTLSGDHWTVPDRPRRDSDALGSLAGTPTEERFGDGSSRKNNASTGNAFRDELRRQDNLL